MIKTIDLDVMQVGCQRVVSRAMERDLISPRLEVLRDVCDNLVFSMRAFIAGEKLTDKEVARWPANWVEAVKERWLPDWLKKSWPVQYKVKEVEMRILYPGLAPSIPERDWRHKRSVRVYVNKIEPDDFGRWAGGQWNEFKDGLTP